MQAIDPFLKIAAAPFAVRALPDCVSGDEPWHFDNDAYVASAGGASLALNGKPVEAKWDQALTRSMVQLGTAVPEELTLTSLLKDLRIGDDDT